MLEELEQAQISQGQSPLLRKLDESDRDRQRVDVMLEFTPLDGLTAALTGSYRMDDYYNSRLGLQSGENWTAGVDLTWAPSERLAVTAGYNYESIMQKQVSRSRPVENVRPRCSPTSTGSP